MGWDNSTFDKADDPLDVGWLISYWRITPCYTDCKEGEDYILQSRQFDHLVLAATREEAVAKFKAYVAQKKASGELSGIKGLVLFLSKVDTVVEISDFEGRIVEVAKAVEEGGDIK